MEARVRLQPLEHGGVLVGAAVVADQVDVELLGNLSVELVRNLVNSMLRCRRCRLEITVAVGDVECREQAGGVVADVVVGRFSGMPGIIGNAGWDRASAWTWLFSSTLSTTAEPGAFGHLRPGPVRRIRRR